MNGFVNNWLKIVHKGWLTCKRKWHDTCLLCYQTNTLQDSPICKLCYDALPWIKKACCRCSASLSRSNVYQCFACRDWGQGIDKVSALFDFKAPINKLVHQLKYQQDIYVAKLFANMMLSHFNSTISYDVIIPVPLTQQRLQQRGFNQSLEIAKTLAKESGMPLSYTTLSKSFDSKCQSSLSKDQRKRNLTASHFTVNKPIIGKRVLLIDDVVTTGITVTCIAGVLKKHGASIVEAWVVCRA